MARGPKKHLKRLNAPSHWMLDKLGGTWAPRPSAGPHKLRESLPIIIVLRQRLKYALTRREAQMICMEKLVQVHSFSVQSIWFIKLRLMAKCALT
jgi:small subunit ribosomal protein S4e